MARYFHPVTAKPLVSVSELLPGKNFFISPERLEEVRQLGNEQHEKLKLGTGVFADILVEIEQKFGKILLQEQALFSSDGTFAGTPDLICERAIVDLKRTFIHDRYHALQLSGYWNLAKDNEILNSHIKNYIILTVDENGKPNFRNVWNEEADMAFIMCKNKYLANARIEKYLRSI